MAIMVQYKDRSFGYEENRALDNLIENQRVIAFRRSDGWAEIGIDPVRNPGGQQVFPGPEKRGAGPVKTCLTCSDFVDSGCRASDCATRTSLQTKEVERNVVY